MGFLPQSQGEWIREAKRAVFVVALFGYLLFLVEGLTTGLGVYRNPTACWIAVACALVALACSSKTQRWFTGLALIFAVVGSLYGYHKNAEWKHKLDRIRAQKPTQAQSQQETNR